ncbi:MAG: hypothetical protein LBK58_14485 [Prevotellaceae bacterium]|jgi:hypothetical protein|nr:hypothetical protein [Prevotellaceae bacterium]
MIRKSKSCLVQQFKDYRLISFAGSNNKTGSYKIIVDDIINEGVNEGVNLDIEGIDKKVKTELLKIYSFIYSARGSFVHCGQTP